MFFKIIKVEIKKLLKLIILCIYSIYTNFCKCCDCCNCGCGHKNIKNITKISNQDLNKNTIKVENKIIEFKINNKVIKKGILLNKPKTILNQSFTDISTFYEINEEIFNDFKKNSKNNFQIQNKKDKESILFAVQTTNNKFYVIYCKQANFHGFFESSNNNLRIIMLYCGPNLNNCSGMFYNNSNLIDISFLKGFNTQNVTNMSNMFSKCSSLTNLDLSSFNTQNVTDMSDMFAGCTSLNNLNLSNFRIRNNTNTKDMFKGCTSLNINNLITNDIKIKNLINNKSEDIFLNFSPGNISKDKIEKFINMLKK